MSEEDQLKMKELEELLAKNNERTKANINDYIQI